MSHPTLSTLRTARRTALAEVERTYLAQQAATRDHRAALEELRRIETALWERAKG